jgi:P4 family phage/plasmid primase-like protien
MNAINFIMMKIAHSTKINRIEEDMIVRYISEVGSMRMNASSLRARVRELRQGEMKGTDHTEVAKAVIKDLEQFGDLRFHNNMFWQWRGSEWTRLASEDIKKVIANNYGSLIAAKKSSDHNGIEKTMQVLLSHDLQQTDLRGINFANGFLTRDLSLMPHAPEYGATYTMPFRYIPELSGRAPKFNEFLYRCWGTDADYHQKLDALQEMLCVTLFGMGPSMQRACLLFGAPATGKTQLLEIAKSIVPDAARSSVGPEEWGDKFLPTKMHKSLINVCGELSENKRIDGRAFKSIIDGTEINGQLKGGQIFQFRPMCTHWFASNHLPKTDDTSEAFNRRWLVLTFNHPVKQEERVNDLGSIIVAEEREAIVAWCVEAMPRLIERQRFTIPDSHTQIMREVANANNSVRFFIQESGRVKAIPPQTLTDGRRTLHLTSEDKIYNIYQSFCLGAGGAKPVGPRPFRSKMRELASEMGFNLRISLLENGTQACVYENITLVEGSML